MNRPQTLVVCVLALVLSAGRANAILGFGDIVFDPSNFEQAIRQLIQLEREYEQIVRTYREIRNQYELAVRMAQQLPVNMVGRYRALVAPWRRTTATNTYGNTAAWLAAINSGSGAASAYGQAVTRLSPYGSVLTNVPPDQVDRLRTQYATVELTDGANLHAMETIGRLRNNAASVERAIQNLEDDSHSGSPAMNTELGVLNKINAANMMLIRSQQDANQLLVALAEAELIRSKRTRDAEAESINNHITFRAAGRRVLTDLTANTSNEMRAWRMP